jgi:hypothetical protein
MYLCKQYIATITISFIIIIAVLEPKLINNIKQSNDHSETRRIAFASATKIELADGNRRESTCCPKTAADATIPLSLEPSVYIVEYSDANDLILVKCG